MDMDTVNDAASTSTVQAHRRRKPLPLHRCRFANWTPSAITALTITPPTFDTALLQCGGESAERGILGVARAGGDVELMVWGGHQGWISWRTIPSSFPLSKLRNSKKPTSLLSHLVFTHQTTLSASDLALYDGDLPGAEHEVRRYEREGVRLFGVGGVGSELVEWEWGGPGAGKEVGRVKSTLPTLPPIFALAASRSSSYLAIGCEDSTIRILNILDDELELISKIEVGGPGKVRALSLAWGPPVNPTTLKGKSREDSPDNSSLPAHLGTPNESYLIAGCSNSTIRRFDVANSGSPAGVWRSIHRMTVDQLKGEQTVVWAIAVLADGTIVSGDSMGNIKFWDGQMGTQSQSFKTHKADVLTLTVGSDGTSIFTSGVDQKTAEFRLVAVSTSSASNGKSSASRWIPSSGRRLHSHDVRAMVVSPPYLLPLPSPPLASSTKLKQVPILTSGGLDLSLIIVCASPALPPHASVSRSSILPNPVSESPSTSFETTIHRRAAYIPQRSKPFSVARDARLLVCRRDRSVGIWKVDQIKNGGREGIAWNRFRDEVEEEDESEGQEGWRKLVEMELKLQTNLVSSAVSNDGKWLAVSDLFETKLFRLQLKNGELSPRRQKTFSTSLSAALPPSLGTGSSSLTFTNDSRRLVLATAFGSSIAIIELSNSKDEVFTVLKVFGEHGDRDGTREIRGKSSSTKSHGVNGHAANGDVEMSGAGSDSDDDDEMDEERTVRGSSRKGGDKPATVACLAVSADGKWLASADLERKVCVFDLSTLKHYTTLPTPSHIPTALSFLPSSTLEPTLLLALPSNAISLFGLTSHRFHQWSLPLSSLSTNTMMDIREPILSVLFEPVDETSGKKLERMIAIVNGANWVAKIDLTSLQHGSSSPSSLPIVRRDADKKRARDEDDGTITLAQSAASKVEIKITRRYQPLVLFDFVGQGEMVAVERLWYDLARDLPEAWVKSGEFGS